jgi:hypothetical protein
VARWRRPYGPEKGFAVSLLFLCVTGGGAVATTIVVLKGQPWHAAYLLFWLATGVLVRAVLVGLQVSDCGVRIRNFWRTHTLAWEDVAGAVGSPDRLWGGEIIRVVTRRRGSFVLIRTPVRRGRSHVPMLAAPGRRSSMEVGAVSSQEFDAILRLLRERAGSRPGLPDRRQVA